MKIKRRGFIALAVLAANHAIGQSSFYSLGSSPETKVNKFKKLFGFKSHYIPSKLISLFDSHSYSFAKIGYKNLLKGCLLNEGKTYAICPMSLKANSNVEDEAFLLFIKESDWRYVGAFNNFESELFLNLSEELKNRKDFELQKILPKKRLIDGLNNPYVTQNAELSFKVKLSENGVSGKLAYSVEDTFKEIVLPKNSA